MAWQIKGRTTADADVQEFSETKLIRTAEDSSANPVDLGALKRRYAGLGQGRRIAPRYGVELEVVLYTPGKSFRTSSVNVSASGALLQDHLPEDFMTGTIDIVFVLKNQNPKKCIAFRGKAVGGTITSQRITFVSSAPAAQETLMNVFETLTPLAG